MARYIRVSNHLRLRDAETIRDGFDHACRLGLRPNFWLTVHWHWTDYAYSEETPAVALWHFLERLRKWFRRRNLPVIWIYTREQPNGGSSEHVHMVLHCPEALESELRLAAPEWAEAYDPRGVHIRRCWEQRTIRGQDYNSRTLALGYMLKAGDEEVKAKYPRAHSRRWSDEQGTIVGKRVGVSAAIGRKAVASFRKTPIVGVIENQQHSGKLSSNINGPSKVSQRISISERASGAA